MFVWSKLSSAKWADAWDERLAGNLNAVTSYLKGGKSIRLQVFCEKKSEAEAFFNHFGGTIREVKSATWIAKQARTNLLKIRDSLVIVGSDSEEEIAANRAKFPDRKILSIPAEMAFGTGDHATTSTCLRLIVDEANRRKKSRWEMLDLGCGTGILALAGRIFGADSALALDFDPQAIEVTKRNIERNKIQSVEAQQQDVLEWQPKKTWDLVAANLFSTILQQAFPVIRKSIAEDGWLVVSGILATQWDETRASGEKSGFVFQKSIKRGKWVTACANVAK